MAVRVALVSTDGADRGFVRADRLLLEHMGHEVALVPGRTVADLLAIPRRLRDADAVAVWHLGEAAFDAVSFARMFRKRSLLILGGGHEYARDRWRGYGIWLRRWDVRARARYTVRAASEVWAVAPHIAPSMFRAGRVRPRSVRVVPTVFDPDRFHSRLDKDIDAAIVLCGPHYDRRGVDRWEIKGLETFLEAVRWLGVRAAVVGTSGTVSLHGGDTVQVTGYLEGDAYADLLSRTQVIVNASRYEGLSNALCEGMLAGAVPVVSDILGNRYAVDGCPYALTFRVGDVDGLAEAIKVALAFAWCAEAGERCRSHVRNRFPVEARREAFERWLT